MQDDLTTQDGLTTLVCLFHHQDQATAAIKDLLTAGVPEPSISLIGDSSSAGTTYNRSDLASLDLPVKDEKHLSEGVKDGGFVVAVEAISGHIDLVENIFGKHNAKLIDKADYGDDLAGDGAAIPIVEEELLVGKRAVDQGGIRVYRRIVEIPVEESINLREEHVNVDRRPVDRAATDRDFAFGDRTIELTETSEEAVVGKTARVVEEVLVGKNVSEHVETITDTVRKTEVDIEEVAASGREYEATRK